MSNQGRVYHKAGTGGLVSLKMGEMMKPVAVEKFKASKGATYFISILKQEFQGTSIHFVDGAGYIYCFGGACCEAMGFPSIRYIIPILEYTTINPQTLEYGAPVTVKYLATGKDRYEEILRKNMLQKDITKRDLMVTCTDEQYQKLQMEVAGDALWRRDAAILEEVKRQYREYLQLLEMSVARRVDPADFERLYLDAQKKAADRPALGQGQGSNKPQLPPGGNSDSHNQKALPPSGNASPPPDDAGDMAGVGDGDGFDFDDLLGEGDGPPDDLKE